MTDRPKGTDEWESVIKAAKRANAQEETRKIRLRPPTIDVPAMKHPASWRGLPLTVGLLIALVLGVVFVAHAVRAYNEDVRQQVINQIVHHDERATAHQNLVQEMRRQNADLRGSVRELRKLVDELATQVRQPRRRR